MPKFDKPFPKHLTQIDELTRPDHSHLAEQDVCLYLGEYSARQGFAFSATNQLILNFKKEVDRRGRPEWWYRNQAIKEAAEAFRSALEPEFWELTTLVPVPPSKTKNHPLYNDRIVTMLRSIKDGLDIRELVMQTESTQAFHEAEVRLRPEDLVALYRIEEGLANPAPRMIAIFDDVISAGCHFKAMQRVLERRFPGIPIWGLFIARRVPEADHFRALFGDIKLPEG